MGGGVKTMDGVIDVEGDVLVLQYSRLAVDKRRSGDLRMPMSAVERIDVTEPTSMRPGVLRVVVPGVAPADKVPQDRLALTFHTRQLQQVRDFVAEVTPRLGGGAADGSLAPGAASVPPATPPPEPARATAPPAAAMDPLVAQQLKTLRQAERVSRWHGRVLTVQLVALILPFVLALLVVLWVLYLVVT